MSLSEHLRNSVECVELFQQLLKNLAIQSMVSEPVAWPGSLSEMHNLGPSPRPTEYEAAVQQDPHVICMDIKDWEAQI